jgi:hypothetical protein
MWERAVRTQPSVSTRMPVERRPVGAVCFPGDTFDRAQWREALEATRDAWQRAWENEPARGEEALRILAGVLFDDGEPTAVYDVGVAA